MSKLTRNDIASALKPADDMIVSDIFATGASKEEFAEACAWLHNDEPFINQGRSLPSGRVEQVVAILQEAEEAGMDEPE